MIKLTYIAVVAAATLNLAAEAQLAIASEPNTWSPDSDSASVKVKATGLDLSSNPGARQMLQRIRGAASTVCQDRLYDPIYRYEGYMSCVNDATDRAVTQLGSPVVTALNGGKGSAAPMALASIR